MNAITSIKAFFIDCVEALGAPNYAFAGRLSVPVDDPHDTLAASHGADHHDAADGQSFAIDYEDHAGNLSHRRISVWAIQRNVEGVPILVARCHEKEAARAFRVDRIKAVTDLDGTPREPLARFFFETFGFIWPKEAARIATAAPEDVRWERIRDVVAGSGVSLLAALARADHDVRAAEVEEMLLYCDDVLAARGFDLTGAERERLAVWLARLRPTVETVEAALDRLQESGNTAVAAVLRAGLKVIGADGVLHEREEVLLDDFCFVLTGRRVRA